MSLCNHRSRGDRTSISVWCSHVSATPAYGNQVRTHCQVTTAPEKKRKKAKKPLLGVVCLLTTGGLISVRPSMALFRAPVFGFFLFGRGLCLWTPPLLAYPCCAWIPDSGLAHRLWAWTRPVGLRRQKINLS